VLISSHLIHEQERICDHVGVMDDGRLLAEMPMAAFRGGIKRLRISKAPLDRSALPFTLLSSGITAGREEEWVVRGWQPAMKDFFTNAECELREVIDLDLEESFVELLRSARQPVAAAGGQN
jgi:ABC-2 type transport system ATP-binding protein